MNTEKFVDETDRHASGRKREQQYKQFLLSQVWLTDKLTDNPVVELIGNVYVITQGKLKILLQSNCASAWPKISKPELRYASYKCIGYQC